MHMTNARALVWVAGALLCLSPAAGAADLMISEILADPAIDWNGDGDTQATTDEWVEVYNAGAMPVNLDGYLLGDADQNLAYGFTGSLAAGDHFVVFGDMSKVWQSANGVAAFGLRLANGGDTVALWQIAGADTVLVESYTYADHEAEDDRSTGRRPDGASTWELFDGLNAYTGDDPPLGNGCAPTPGITNNCITPVEDSTWGRIKHELR